MVSTPIKSSTYLYVLILESNIVTWKEHNTRGNQGPRHKLVFVNTLLITMQKFDTICTNRFA